MSFCCVTARPAGNDRSRRTSSLETRPLRVTADGLRPLKEVDQNIASWNRVGARIDALSEAA